MSDEVKIRVQVASGDKKPFRITQNQNYDTSFLAEIFARFAINPTQVKPNQVELCYSDGDDSYTIRSQGDFNEFYKEAQTQAKRGGTLDLNVKLPGSTSTSPKTTSIPSPIRQSESKPPVSNGTANRMTTASVSQAPRKPPGAGSHRPKQPSTTLAEASSISPLSTPREKQVLGSASGLTFEEAKEKWTTSIAIFNQSVKSGDIPKAIEHGTILLSLDPDNATILYNRGVAYAAQEKHDLAIADWSKCLNIQPNHAMALIGRGNAYAAVGNYSNALADLKQATSLAPTSASAHHALSVTLTQMGEYQDAINSETKAIDLIENKTSGSGAGVEMFELYYNRGWAHSRAGNNQKAIQDYTKSLALNSRLTKANMSRAKVLRDTGDVNSAIDDYNKVVTTDPKSWKGFHERAVCWHLKDEIQKAIDDDTTSINIQPSFDAYYNRAIAYAKLGMLDKAIQDNTSALQHQPRNPHALCNRGVAHSALGHWPEAIADWTASIEAEPTVAALNARALAYYNNGEIDKALADWERSIAMCPEYNALVNRGNHWLSTGNPDRAIKDYTQAIGLNVPDPSAAYCNRAAAYCALGLWDEAIADCDAALAINPMLAQAWHNRGIAMAGKKNWDQSYLDHNMSALIEPDNEVYRQARDDAKQLASEAALRQAERDTEEFYRKHPHLRPKIAERNEYKGAKGERGDFKGISPELYERLKKMGLTDEEIAALADDNIRLTDEELADLMAYFPHLFKNGKLIIGDLTPEMKLRLAMYRQRVKKYPVLKRWKPLLAACIDSSTWAIQSQFAPLSTGGTQKAGQSKWKVQTNVRPKMS